ncbi:MAG TPA: hypothetical protein DEQ34_07670 [Balneolaceae bacterium]|mgnify:CR=1 FL=1|nr:hypothetical protein [Balneolaceae bacterium]
MKVRYAIIDDDPQALESVEYYLKNISIPGLEMEMVHKQHDLDFDSEADHEVMTNIDVLFLDIMLRDKNSLDVIRLFGDEQPLTVVTTAHDEHMLKAIRISAFDYLLKPVDEDDFVQMLERLKARLDKDYLRMKEWLSLSNVISPHHLNDKQAKQLSNIQDPVFESISSAYPQLTILDKRLLVLIKFGFSNKEIAQHLFIEPDSVKRSKVRLKKRMDLPKEQSIEEALTAI